MKTNNILKLSVFLIAAGRVLSAAPIGQPASPALLGEGVFIPDTTWCQPRVAFFEDFTAQHLLVCNTSPSPVQKMFSSGTAQLAAATWSIRERLDISVILGTAQNHFQMFQGPQLVDFQAKGGLVWYGEAKVIILEMKDTSVCAFGEAGGSDWMSGPFNVQLRPSGSAHLKMRFWEVGAAVAQKIGLFSPYIGVVVLRSRWKATAPSSVFRFQQKYPVGPFLGCSLTTSSLFALNVEWRGWVENAWTISGELRF